MKKTTLKPFQNIRDIASFQDNLGKKALEEGKVGCILVAGGQGTRLGLSGPKGCLQVTPATHQTLFQYFAEKLKAASKRYKKPLKMAIMTSLENHEETVKCFHSSQISFFTQGELPLLHEDGSPSNLTGPDGNGACVEAFFNSGIGDAWMKEGIEYVTFILVDNPLADPFDAALISAHIQEGVEASIKCIQRADPEEKLGILVEENGHPAVLEYMEIPKEDRTRPFAGNISLFCFSMPFLKRVSKVELPLHRTLKKNLWKFEKFIFDILPYSHSTQALLYPREMTFAPIKDSTDLEKARKALTLKDRKILEAITGTGAPPSVLEIDPAFHYPDSDLLAKWKGRKIPSSPYVAS